jgi:hypothetical protein
VLVWHKVAAVSGLSRAFAFRDGVRSERSYWDSSVVLSPFCSLCTQFFDDGFEFWKSSLIVLSVRVFSRMFFSRFSQMVE